MCANELFRVTATDANNVASEFKFTVKRGVNIIQETTWQASNIFESNTLPFSDPSSYTLIVNARTVTDIGICEPNPAPATESFIVYRL